MMLQKAVEKADITQADLVIFGGCEYDDKHGTIRKVDSILNESLVPKKEVFSSRYCAEKLYQLTQGMAWNKLFRRNFLQKYNLRFQRIKYTDDAYFTFAYMALAEKITVIRENLCFYRVNSGNNQSSGITNYPDSAYVPYMALKSSLEAWGLYDMLKQSFVNCAATFIRRSYDEIDRYDSFKYLHDKLRGEIFDKLEIGCQSADFFYDKRLYQWVCQVVENTAGELVFQAARAFGGNVTTGILRFQFPYSRIPRGCRLALVGDDVVGRYYYAQLILGGYCDIACWVGESNPFHLSCVRELNALKETAFDYVLVACMQPQQIDRAVSVLKEFSIPDERIVLAYEENES